MFRYFFILSSITLILTGFSSIIMATGLYIVCPDITSQLVKLTGYNFSFASTVNLCFFICWFFLWLELAFKFNQILNVAFNSDIESQNNNLQDSNSRIK